MATEKKEVLHLIFEDDRGKQKTLRVPDPREDVTAAEIQTAMQTVIDKDFLSGAATIMKGAKVVETLTEEFDVIS